MFSRELYNVHAKVHTIIDHQENASQGHKRTSLHSCQEKIKGMWRQECQEKQPLYGASGIVNLCYGKLKLPYDLATLLVEMDR